MCPLPGGYIVEKSPRSIYIAAFLVVLLASPSVALLAAQSTHSPAAEQKTTVVAGFSPANEANLRNVRDQLFKLLRMSPKLTSAVAHDSSLLGYQEYVNHSHPELAAFLQAHPEIARNPEFYLFANLPGGTNRDIQFVFQRAVWPEMGGRGNSSGELIAFFVFLVILTAILWLLRMLLQNRRWGRIFKVQTEFHTKLLDKLSGSQELFSYLGSETGRKFLEMAPIATALESPSRPGLLSPITRILAPFQVGVVATLVGIGLLYIKPYFKDSGMLLLIGTMGLMLGIGLILSAGFSWMLARRLGLLAQIKPENADAKTDPS